MKGKYTITSLTSTPDFHPPNLLLWLGNIWMKNKFASCSFLICMMQTGIELNLQNPVRPGWAIVVQLLQIESKLTHCLSSVEAMHRYISHRFSNRKGVLHLQLRYCWPLLCACCCVSGKRVGQHQRIGTQNTPDVAFRRLNFLPWHGHLIQDQEVVVRRPDGACLRQEGWPLKHQGHRHRAQGHQVKTKELNDRKMEWEWSMRGIRPAPSFVYFSCGCLYLPSCLLIV